MSVTQQHLLDTYRALHLGSPVPPAPGTQDVRVVRELRELRRFLAGRRPRGRTRQALGRWLNRRPRPSRRPASR
ncbi:hypothetical protein [Streptomyces canus]|uniref:hypothetical protein n=1 Tax=Streptomyces canus TaxID=58343 RepID=UPI0009A0C653|nr:hypothetical protein [Streptomyces canus]